MSEQQKLEALVEKAKLVVTALGPKLGMLELAAIFAAAGQLAVTLGLGPVDYMQGAMRGWPGIFRKEPTDNDVVMTAADVIHAFKAHGGDARAFSGVLTGLIYCAMTAENTTREGLIAAVEMAWERHAEDARGR